MWHNQSAEEALKQLRSSASGLSQSEAEKRLLEYGKNELPQGKKRNVILAFLSHFHDVLIYVLLGAAVVTMLLDHWVDAGVILAVVLINAIIGYVQEGKAEKAMDAIRHLIAPKANVLRDNERASIEGGHLVPGDIVLLEAGNKVPADIRLLSAYGLLVQEAILTGESLPLEKTIDPVSKEAALGDRHCMLFSGTTITAGQGKGLVVATGKNTEIGRISGLLAEVETLTTPLVRQIGAFAKWLTVFILGVSASLFVFAYFSAHHDFATVFLSVVGLAVAAIPEGLPAVLTITLAVGVQAMARKNAIIRRLPSIETLGSVSVICTDKTGTLTKNEMMVASAVTAQNTFIIEGNGYEPIGHIKSEDTNTNPLEHSTLLDLVRAGVLCNDAALLSKDGIWRVEGDPMEGALLSLAGKFGIDIKHEQARWSRTDTIPFDSKHRFMATLNHDHEGQNHVFVKGAPERLLEMCKDQRTKDGKTEPLDTAYWNNLAETVAGRGQRVLAFAMKTENEDNAALTHKKVEGTLTLIGMVGLIDPPRPEAIEAVGACQEAGIVVKMITGDHAKTAAAIGEKIGLANHANVLTGVDLDNMDDAELKDKVLSCDIFARTTPEHKLRLVQALQSYQLTVAMTGDGVNDSPALKRADVGIAMGIQGSEVAKEASDLVLADDNFASISAAVREGRTVYDNIKKVISWTLPTNAGESLTIIVALLFGLTLPITPIQILWVNLVTAVTLGIALAFEPTEENTMKRPPRARNEPILSKELVWHIALVSTLFLGGVYGSYVSAIDRGYSLELARTIALNTLVVMEIFHLFFIRNIYGTSLSWKTLRGTNILWSVVFLVLLAQFAITYIPLMQKIFATEAIPFIDVMIIVGIGMGLFVIIEAEKQIRLRVFG